MPSRPYAPGIFGLFIAVVVLIVALLGAIGAIQVGHLVLWLIVGLAAAILL